MKIYDPSNSRVSPDMGEKTARKALVQQSHQDNSVSSEYTVILGVAESDAHVVANQLIAARLASAGFRVVNLGACTSLAEFAAAYAQCTNSVAILIGSLNGHALQDLQGLAQVRARAGITCPIIVGGKLALNEADSIEVEKKLLRLGVDVVIHDIEHAIEALVDGRLVARKAV